MKHPDIYSIQKGMSVIVIHQKGLQLDLLRNRLSQRKLRNIVSMVCFFLRISDISVCYML